MVNNQYVKFVKGTLSAYEHCSKDPNTLYFVTDSNGDISLYLGANLISSSIPKEEIITLTQLADVTLKTKIEPNSILVYNDSNSQWEDVTLEDLSTLLSIPTSEGIQEIAENVVSGVINDAPEAFDTLKEIADWILKDGTGAAALVQEFGDFKTQVGDLSFLSENQTLAGLVATNAQTIETTQSNLNNLITKVGDLSALEENQTLTGLATTTQNNLNTLTTTVGDLKASVEVLEGLLKDSEGGTIDLSSYVTKDVFASTVGSLEDINNIELSNLKTEEKNSLIGAINELHDQLVWGEITTNS